MFVEIKSSFLNVADFFKSSCSDTSHFDVRLILYFFAVQIQEQKYHVAHCIIVHWNGHGITHMRLWPSMIMQYIRTKQAEKKWSLYQYNFLVGSSKTAPLAWQSEVWITIPTQKSHSQTSAGGKRDSPNIFFKNWLTSETFFPFCLLSPKNCIFLHQLCLKWTRHTLTSKPGHTVVTALWMAVSKSA